MTKNICFLETCNDFAHGLGLCKFHYQRYRNGRDLFAPRTINNKHNLANHLYYTKWGNIMDRCYNPNCKSYADYGGRGIRVYGEWHKNPEAFIEYIIALDKPSEKHNSIDRIDNNGNYEPGNLRWATKSEQQINRRIQDSLLGVRGVYPNRRKFRARINVNGKRIEIGSFNTIEEAKSARKEAERKYEYDHIS